MRGFGRLKGLHKLRSKGGDESIGYVTLAAAARALLGPRNFEIRREGELAKISPDTTNSVIVHIGPLTEGHWRCAINTTWEWTIYDSLQKPTRSAGRQVRTTGAQSDAETNCGLHALWQAYRRPEPADLAGPPREWLEEHGPRLLKEAAKAEIRVRITDVNTGAWEITEASPTQEEAAQVLEEILDADPQGTASFCREATERRAPRRAARREEQVAQTAPARDEQEEPWWKDQPLRMPLHMRRGRYTRACNALKAGLEAAVGHKRAGRPGSIFPALKQGITDAVKAAATQPRAPPDPSTEQPTAAPTKRAQMLIEAGQVRRGVAGRERCASRRTNGHQSFLQSK